MEGIVGGADPFMSVSDAVRDGHFDEIIVSTLSKKTSKWLRRDLVRKIEGLGLPVTAVTPRATGQGVTDRKEFDAGIISGGGGLPWSPAPATCVNQITPSGFMSATAARHARVLLGVVAALAAGSGAGRRPHRRRGSRTTRLKSGGPRTHPRWLALCNGR